MEKLEALTLLRVGEEASPAEIEEAYRKRVREVRKRFDAADLLAISISRRCALRSISCRI